MLAAVRRRFTLMKTYRRIRGLWDEFTHHINASAEFKEYAPVLSAFLDHFQAMYEQHIQGVPTETLDRIYGDCTDILLSLIDFVDQHDVASAAVSEGADSSPAADATVERAETETTVKESEAEDAAPTPETMDLDPEDQALLAELVYKSLAVAELILRDEKYRDKLKETPEVVARIVSLLDRVDGPEGKGVLLQLLSTLGSDSDHSLQIGHFDGFRKMLVLLVKGDETLRKQILQTMHHLLATRKDSSDAAAAATSPEDGSQSQQDAATAAAAALAAEQGDLDYDQLMEDMLAAERASSDSNPAPSAADRNLRTKLTDVVFDLGKLAMNALGSGSQEAASQPASETSGPTETPGSDAATASEHSSPDDKSTVPPPKLFPPPRRALEEATAMFAEILRRERRELQQEAAASSRQQHSRSSKQRSKKKKKKRRRKKKHQQQQLQPQQQHNPQASGDSESAITGEDSDNVVMELMRVQGALKALMDTLSQAALTVQLDVMTTISQLLLQNRRNQVEFKQIDGYTFILQHLDSVANEPDHIAQPFIADCFRLIARWVIDGDRRSLAGNFDALRWVFHVVAHAERPLLRLEALQCLQDILSSNPLNAAAFHQIGGIHTLLNVLEQSARHPCLCVCRLKLQLQADAEHTVIERCDSLLKYVAVIFTDYDRSLVSEYFRLLRTFPFPIPDVRGLVLRSVAQLLRYYSAPGGPHMDAPHAPVTPVDQLMQQCVEELQLSAVDLRNACHSHALALSDDDDAGAATTRPATQAPNAGELELFDHELDMPTPLGVRQSALQPKRGSLRRRSIENSDGPGSPSSSSSKSSRHRARSRTRHGDDTASVSELTSDEEEEVEDDDNDDEDDDVDPTHGDEATRERRRQRQREQRRRQRRQRRRARRRSGSRRDEEDLAALSLRVVWGLELLGSVLLFPPPSMRTLESLRVAAERLDEFMRLSGYPLLSSLISPHLPGPVVDCALYLSTRIIERRNQVKLEQRRLLSQLLAAHVDHSDSETLDAVEPEQQLQQQQQQQHVHPKQSPQQPVQALSSRKSLPMGALARMLPVDATDPAASSSAWVEDHSRSLLEHLIAHLSQRQYPAPILLRIVRALIVLLERDNDVQVEAPLSCPLHGVDARAMSVDASPLPADGSDADLAPPVPPLSRVHALLTTASPQALVSRCWCAVRRENLSLTHRFRELEGFAALLKVMQRCSSVAMAQACWQLFVAAVNGNEENQQFLASHIGFVTMAELIKRTPLPLGTDVFATIFDLVTVSPSWSLSPPNDDASGWRFLAEARSLSRSQPLSSRTSPLDRPPRAFSSAFSSLPQPGFVSNVIVRLASDQRHAAGSACLWISEPPPVGHDGSCFMLPSAESSPSNAHQTWWTPDWDLTRRVRKETQSGSRSRSSSVASNSDESGGTVKLQAMARFRSTEAALMAVILTPHASLIVQRAVIKQLAQLLDRNPSNKRALCRVDVVSTLLRLVPQFHEQVQHSYVQLVTSLAMYDVSPEQTRLFFDLALHGGAFSAASRRLLGVDDGTKKPSEGVSSTDETASTTRSRYQQLEQQRDEELQMQMLYVIGRVVERKTPTCFFSFDGSNDFVRVPPMSRFPAAKLGYSVCFWVQHNAFCEEDACLLGWHRGTAGWSADSAAFYADAENLTTASLRADGLFCRLVLSLDPSDLDPHSRSLVLLSPPLPRAPDADGADEPEQPSEPTRTLLAAHQFSDRSPWRLVVITHKRQEMQVYVNGVPVSDKPVEVPVDAYPHQAHKNTPVCGMIAAPTAPLPLPQGGAPPSLTSLVPEGVATTSFCGSVSAVHVLEGALTPEQVQFLFERESSLGGVASGGSSGRRGSNDSNDPSETAMPTSFKHLGFSNKRIEFLQPAEFVTESVEDSPTLGPVGKGKDATVGSQSADGSRSSSPLTTNKLLRGSPKSAPSLRENSPSPLTSPSLSSDPASPAALTMGDFSPPAMKLPSPHSAIRNTPLQLPNPIQSPPQLPVAPAVLSPAYLRSSMSPLPRRSGSPPRFFLDSASDSNGEERAAGAMKKETANGDGGSSTRRTRRSKLRSRSAGRWGRRRGDERAKRTQSTRSPERRGKRSKSSSRSDKRSARSSPPLELVEKSESTKAVKKKKKAKKNKKLSPGKTKKPQVQSNTTALPSQQSFPLPETALLASQWAPTLPPLPSVDAHCTRAIKQQIQVIGGVTQCLPLLLLNPGAQVAGLRILGSFLERSQRNVDEFERRHGLEVLGVLLPERGLSPETFDVLLEIGDGRIGTDLLERCIRRPGVLTLILDLLHTAGVGSDLRVRVFGHMLVEMMTSPLASVSQHNLEVWRAGPNIYGLIDLLRLAPECLPSILLVLDALLDVCDYMELRVLLSFLVTDPTQLVPEKSAIARILREAITRRAELLTHLFKAGGFSLLFLMLAVPSEAMRCEVLRIMGISFELAASKKYVEKFVRAGGFLVLERLLSESAADYGEVVGEVHDQSEPMALTPAITDVLLRVGIGYYTLDEQAHSKKDKKSSEQATPRIHRHRHLRVFQSDTSSGRRFAETPRGSNLCTDMPPEEEAAVDLSEHKLKFPQVFRATLMLASRSSSVHVHLHVLGQLSRLLRRDENLDLIAVQSKWHRWLRDYLQRIVDEERSPLQQVLPGEDTTGFVRVVTRFQDFLLQVLVRDWQRSVKQSSLAKVRDMVESPDFQAVVTQTLVDFVERNPRLEKKEERHVGNILRNLAHHFEYLSRMLAVPPLTCVRVVELITFMAAQNDAQVRGKMKDVGLFPIRETLILDCIRRQDIAPEQRTALLPRLNLDLLVPSSQRLQAVIFLLWMFHHQESFALRVQIASVLRSQLSEQAEQMRPVIKLVADSRILQALFPRADPDDLRGDPSAACFAFWDVEEDGGDEDEGDGEDVEEEEEEEEDDDGVEEEEVPLGQGGAEEQRREARKKRRQRKQRASCPKSESLEDFVRWYFSAGQAKRRSAVVERIMKEYKEVSGSYEKALGKTKRKLAKSLKLRVRKQEKALVANEKLISEALRKSKPRLDKCWARYTELQQERVAERLARQELGDTSWAAIVEHLSGVYEALRIEGMVVKEESAAAVVEEDDDADSDLTSPSASLASPSDEADERVKRKQVAVPKRKGKGGALGRCPLCSVVFYKQWERVCHLRLDHM